ncbi:MAG: hypothetical protein EHM87_05805 [Burkholderiales bacterium]|nr:MAG: hypothetical protein EHM87_05805 [Burkholderiales bacterium]
MGKVMTWVVIGLLVWGAWRLWTISRVRAERARDAARAAGDPPAAAGGNDGDAAEAGREPRRPNAPELMMQCAVCGVHLPGSEARFSGGKVYCSDAHRDAAGVAGPVDATRRDGR